MNWSRIPRQPSLRTLGQCGLLCLVVFGTGAGWRDFMRAELASTALVIAVGLACGALGTVASLLRPIFSGWIMAILPVGWVTSRLILGALYFLLLTPVGVLLRLMGHDPLSLRRKNTASFWTEKKQPSHQRRYLRQY